MSADRHLPSYRHVPRLFVLLILCAATPVSGVVHAAALPWASAAAVELGAQDDHHESARTEAGVRREAARTTQWRQTRRRRRHRPWSAAQVRRPIGRSYRSPVLWRGPPVLLI